MTYKTFITVPIVLTILILCSCSEASQNPDIKNGAGRKKLDPTILSSNGYDAYLAAVTERNDGVSSPDNAQFQILRFYDSSGSSVPVSSASLNGTSIDLSSNNDIKNFSFNGADHVWAVTGGIGFPSFTDTCETPNQFDITGINAWSDTLDLSTGRTISYTSTGTDSVYIFVEFQPGVSRRLTSYTGSDFNVKGYYAVSSGSFSIPPTDLTAFPTTGVVSIRVVAVKIKDLIVSGKRIRLYAISSSKTNLFVKP